jgi:large subunit ribosomal protein L23
MRNYHDIIIAPILTERTMDLQAENKYTFLVDRKANKTEIKNAIEKIFSVDVTAVRTINVKPKPKRVGRYLGKTAAKKKAIVAVKNGQSIKLFDNL